MGKRYLAAIIVAILLIVALASAPSYANDTLNKRAVDSFIETYGCMLEGIVWEAGAPESPGYFTSVIMTESTGKPDKVSKHGAIGLMQVKPIALKQVRQAFPDVHFSDDLFDPRNNMKVGVYYHAWLKYEYKLGMVFGDAAEVSVGYNLGPSGGAKYLRSNDAYDFGYVESIESWTKYQPVLICNMTASN